MTLLRPGSGGRGDILTRIAAYKLQEVAERKAQTSVPDLEAAARQASAPRGFARALEAAHSPGRVPGRRFEVGHGGLRLPLGDLFALVGGDAGEDVVPPSGALAKDGHAGALVSSTSLSREAMAAPSITEARARATPSRSVSALPATRKPAAAFSTTAS